MKWFILVLALLIAVPVVAQDCNVEVVKRVSVIYPDSAKAKGIEGTVYVQATIGTDGIVKVAMVTKTDNELLNEAALNAVVKWTFKHIQQECKITIPIRFKLSQ